MSAANDDEFKAISALLKACEADRQSLPTKAEQLVRLGEKMQQLMEKSIEVHVGRLGDTPANRRAAVSLCYRFIRETMGVSTPSARAYIRCYQKFGDNPAATRHLTYGVLSALAGRNVSADHIDAIVRAKAENPDMTRQELMALFRSLTESHREDGRDAS
ncbi:hypothetical protein H3V53_15185 [Paraburkholderia bengalensis]|uniref:Uncharacterized protein n=1 Tax=Paraburkholderia bengalensis TaxID=2747562 RepID=A0ABU8ISQ4_9BURK